MVYLNVHKRPTAAARAMGLCMDSATSHIGYYLRHIRRSEDLQQAVLLKHTDLLEAHRAASANVETNVGDAGAGDAMPVDRKCFTEAIVTVAKMYRDKDERTRSFKRAARYAREALGVPMPHEAIRQCFQNNCETPKDPGRERTKSDIDHNVTIHAALAAVRRLANENDTHGWRKLKLADLKAVLTAVHADTRGSKEALVDRCLDEGVVLKIKEQLLTKAAEEGEGEEGDAFEGDSENGEETSEDDA
jgi:hypothetical protein